MANLKSWGIFMQTRPTKAAPCENPIIPSNGPSSAMVVLISSQLSSKPLSQSETSSDLK